jgi:hypothetical protein
MTSILLLLPRFSDHAPRRANLPLPGREGALHSFQSCLRLCTPADVCKFRAESALPIVLPLRAIDIDFRFPAIPQGFEERQLRLMWESSRGKHETVCAVPVLLGRVAVAPSNCFFCVGDCACVPFACSC